LNIHKIQTVAKKALAAALPLALCFSIAGCSLKFKIFDNSDFKPTSESEALLSKIPEPKQTNMMRRITKSVRENYLRDRQFMRAVRETSFTQRTAT
jgi:hypothetical protein